MGQKVQKVRKQSSSWKTKCGLLFLGITLGFCIFPLFNPAIEKLEPYTQKFYNVCLENASNLLEKSSFYISKAQKALQDKIKKNKDFLDHPLS